MEIQGVLFKDVLDSMFDKQTNTQEVAEMAAKLVMQGYMVQKICCGECDQDDLLVQVHTCNPHNYTHKCTPKRKG
jgi:predicted metal-dependent enzyme (double-stranded beta helix superfamily)